MWKCWKKWTKFQVVLNPLHDLLFLSSYIKMDMKEKKNTWETSQISFTVFTNKKANMVWHHLNWMMHQIFTLRSEGEWPIRSAILLVWYNKCWLGWGVARRVMTPSFFYPATVHLWKILNEKGSVCICCLESDLCSSASSPPPSCAWAAVVVCRPTFRKHPML